MAKVNLNEPALYIPAIRDAPRRWSAGSFFDWDVPSALTLVGLNGEGKVEHVCWIWEVRLHGLWQLQLGQVWQHRKESRQSRISLCAEEESSGLLTLLDAKLCGRGLGLLLLCRLLLLLHAPDLPRQAKQGARRQWRLVPIANGKG